MKFCWFDRQRILRSSVASFCDSHWKKKYRFLGKVYLIRKTWLKNGQFNYFLFYCSFYEHLNMSLSWVSLKIFVQRFFLTILIEVKQKKTVF